jgi:hypothetical protein
MTFVKNKWTKIIGIYICLIALLILNASNSISNLHQRFATIELFSLVLGPLIIFYLRNNWPYIKWIICIPVILTITIFTYSFLHEFSHVIGLYVVGAKPTGYQLIPEYWKGDFTKAWVSSIPLNNWKDPIPGIFPYIKDCVFLTLGYLILLKTKISNCFLSGLIYCFFILSPSYDIINNFFIKLIVGEIQGNDFYGLSQGWGEIWAIIIGVSFSLYSIFISIIIPLYYKDHPDKKNL